MQHAFYRPTGLLAAVLLTALVAACDRGAGAQSSTNQYAPSRAAMPFSRCVNLANALNAPKEGEWGYVIEEEHLSLIADAGFDSVRVLVNWAANAQARAPYTIDPALFARVDTVTRQALDRGLGVIIDLHDYGEVYERPFLHGPRAVGLWEQIAAHYATWPDTVVLEVMNEPREALSGPVWDALARDLVASVRRHDEDRLIILGGDQWNAAEALPNMAWPDDPYLVATFHYYTPYDFTHQGADWFDNPPPLGATWGSARERRALEETFDDVMAWAEARGGPPVFLGEFGVFKDASEAERAAWTSAVRQAAEARGMAWCYFDFTAGFNAYDRETETWREEILDALGLSGVPDLR